jgi:hypothetical protein
MKHSHLLVGLVLILLTSSAFAQETAHYPNGTSGILAGTLPPPGNYWLYYNLFLPKNRLNDRNGNKVLDPAGDPINLNVNTYGNAHRFLFVYDDFFGICDSPFPDADFSWNVVTPFIANSVEITNFGVNDSSVSFGDLNVEPFVVEWRKPRYDIGFVYGFFAPTGQRSDARPSLPGRRYWTHYIGPAGTYYFDDDKTIHFSFLSRYEFHTESDQRDLLAGQFFSFEWGLGKTFQDGLTLGASGYCLWQTTRDTGADAVTPDDLNRAFGVGPEIQCFFPEYKFGLHFRLWWEFDVRSQAEGMIANLTVVIPLQ